MRERVVEVTRVTFQYVVIAIVKIETVNNSKLSIAEQTIGNILLKV